MHSGAVSIIVFRNVSFSRSLFSTRLNSSSNQSRGKTAPHPGRIDFKQMKLQYIDSEASSWDKRQKREGTKVILYRQKRGGE
jgi:hypothetical protein